MAIISNEGLGMKAAATTVSAAFLSRTKKTRERLVEIDFLVLKPCNA